MGPNWELAEQHLKDIEDRYFFLITVPGVNTRLALTFVIEPLVRRFQGGERTDDLYQEIMRLE